MRILLIEDDHILGAAIHEQIVSDGHSVDWLKRLDEAESYRRAAIYDLILLDMMLPDGFGLHFLKRIRKARDNTPVLILTALDQISDRIEGLNAGADDYLVKPFHLSELSARIGAISRRYAGNPSPVLTFDDIQVNLTEKTIERGGKTLTLTAREWAIAESFFLAPKAILSKSQLEERVQSFQNEVQSNTVEVYVSRLRKKLGPGFIKTERGLGYRLGIQ